MGTTLPINIKEVLRKIGLKYTMYLAGGSLCYHPTQDYDILVFNEGHTNLFIREITKLKDKGLISNVMIFPVYEDQINNPYRTIITTKIDNIKVDFLLCKLDMSLFDILSTFPLSIQMKAESILTGERYHGINYSANPIVMYDGRGSAEAKYRKYYPDIPFVDTEGNIVEAPNNDFPF